MSDFLTLLHGEVDVRGQAIGEVVAPDVVAAVTEAIDEWHEMLPDQTAEEAELWESKLRSALVYKSLQSLARELEKTMSMHRDLVFTTLWREDQEATT